MKLRQAISRVTVIALVSVAGETVHIGQDPNTMLKCG
jgi:hypothetical protein